MKHGGKIAFCLASGLAVTAVVRADGTVSPGEPYATVVVRNIFGLNPPPPPNANPPDANPPPKITPNGIISILGELQVLFKVASPPKPGVSTPSNEAYVLSEGQRQDDIEVVKIDEKNSIVTFNNHGETQTLPLVTTMPASTPSAGPEAPAGGKPAGPGGRFSPGFVNPGGAAGPRPRGATGSAGAANYGGLGSQGNQGNQSNQGNVPSLGTAPTHSNTFDPASQIPEGMTPEVQTIAIEANRELTKQQVEAGELPPLPNTDLTPEPDSGGSPQ